MRDDRDARGVSVAFGRRGGEECRVGARLSTPLSLEKIAAALEASLGFSPTSGGDDIEVTLISRGAAFAVDSARLASMGAALFRRAGNLLVN